MTTVTKKKKAKADSEKKPEERPMPRVSEGAVLADERIFSVVMPAGAVGGDDLSPVAAAVDGRSGLRIPAPGDPHPRNPELLVGEPTIFCVGLRVDGVLVATRSRFFNVRVRYRPATAAGNSNLESRNSNLPEAKHGCD